MAERRPLVLIDGQLFELPAGDTLPGGGGMTIGGAVTGGGANRVLYEDGSQNLAASVNLIFNGTSVGIGNPTLSSPGGFSPFIKIKGAPSLVFENTISGESWDFGVDNAGSFVAYGGTPTGYGLSVSPSDKQATFYGRIVTTKTTEQLRLGYDGSNYFTATVGSTGIVTLDAVGSGAKFVFSDPIQIINGGLLLNDNANNHTLTVALEEDLSANRTLELKVNDADRTLDIRSDVVLDSGTYTPTRSAEANLDANITPFQSQWLQVGNTVTVSGRFTADPTLAATTTSFEFTLPVASNIGAVEDVAGVAFCGAIAGMGAAVSGSVANNTAVFTWVSSDITSQSWSFSFSYQVI